MAANTTISNAAAIVGVDNILDLIDAGSGAGKIRIYGGGSGQPANPDVAVSDQTLLAELTLSDPAFAGATDGAPGGVATANSITDDSSADGTGTADWFRVLDSDNNAIIDGSAGEAADSPDLTLDNKDINAGQTVSITSWTVTMPES